MPRIIVIGNSKGGVAKSTTTAALADAAVRDGNRTLVIELDPQGTASLISRIKVADNDVAVSTAMFTKNPTPPSQLARPTIYGYDIIPANASLKDVDEELHKLHLIPLLVLKSHFRLDEGLKQYDVILIDTAAATPKMLRNALFAATHLVVPIAPSNAVLDALRDFLTTVDEVNQYRTQDGQPPVKHAGLVWTKVKEHTVSHQKSMEEVEEQFASHPEIPISRIRIPDSTVVQDAERSYAPVTIFRPSHTVSKQYFAFWDEISGRKKNTNSAKVVSL